MTDDSLPQATDAAPIPDVPSPPLADRPSGSPAPRRLSAVAAIVQIVLCSGVPTQLLLQLLALAVGLVTPQGELSLGYAAGLLTGDAVLTVALVLLFLYASGDRPSLVFFGERSATVEGLLGLMLLPIAFALVLITSLVIQRYAPSLHPEENPFGRLIREPNGVLIIGGLGVLAGAVREEMQRAFALHRFTQLGVPTLGLLLFSIGFGLGHGFQGADAMIMTTFLGLLWGGVYLARRSLVAPAVCHAGFNVVQVLAYGLLLSHPQAGGGH